MSEHPTKIRHPDPDREKEELERLMRSIGNARRLLFEARESGAAMIRESTIAIPVMKALDVQISYLDTEHDKAAARYRDLVYHL